MATRSCKGGWEMQFSQAAKGTVKLGCYGQRRKALVDMTAFPTDRSESLAYGHQTPWTSRSILGTRTVLRCAPLSKEAAVNSWLS